MENFKFWFPLVVPVTLAATNFILISTGTTFDEVVISKGITTFAFSIMTIDVWGITFIGTVKKEDSNMIFGWFLALVIHFLLYSIINVIAQNYLNDRTVGSLPDLSKVVLPACLAVGSFLIAIYFRWVQWKNVERKPILGR